MYTPQPTVPASRSKPSLQPGFLLSTRSLQRAGSSYTPSSCEGSASAQSRSPSPHDLDALSSMVIEGRHHVETKHDLHRLSSVDRQHASTNHDLHRLSSLVLELKQQMTSLEVLLKRPEAEHVSESTRWDELQSRLSGLFAEHEERMLAALVARVCELIEEQICRRQQDSLKIDMDMRAVQQRIDTDMSALQHRVDMSLSGVRQTQDNMFLSTDQVYADVLPDKQNGHQQELTATPQFQSKDSLKVCVSTAMDQAESDESISVSDTSLDDIDGLVNDRELDSLGFAMDRDAHDHLEDLHMDNMLQQIIKSSTQPHSWHLKAFKKVVHRKSWWQKLSEASHGSIPTPSKPNQTRIISDVVNGSKFGCLCFSVTILNALLIGLEANATMHGMMQDPPEEAPHWLYIAQIAFAAFFVMDVLLRLMADRLWFFVDLQNWTWNWIDFLVAITSVVSLWGVGSGLTLMRLLRGVRIIRVAKIVRNSAACRHLRQIMLTLMASFTTLCWALVFLSLTVFIFSIFFLNAATGFIESKNFNDDIRNDFRECYSSLPRTMLCLLASVSGGKDWLDVMKPLEMISKFYQAVFAFYVMFVVLGVVNVLTAVFLQSATEFSDRTLTVQAERDSLEFFVGEMLDLFNEIQPSADGCVSWQQFEEFLRQGDVEAYLSSHMLETTHARLLFKMLDHDHTGTISIDEFVIGMLRLKGGAKTYDSRVLLHELCKVRGSLTALEERLGMRRRAAKEPKRVQPTPASPPSKRVQFKQGL